MEGIIRQGDVWLIPLTAQQSSELDGLRKLTKAEVNSKEGIIVAAGEATGHHHRVRTRGTRLYDLSPARRMRMKAPDRQRVSAAANRLNTDTVLSVPKGGATITHEEHAALEIPEGDFKVVIAREYVPQAAPRRVYD